ncbi:MAG: glycosyltransferase family 2 protein [Phycisphaerales bacterium]|nr:glycosyltransferase family 2 protein [Phycisphaerales bacterium]
MSALSDSSLGLQPEPFVSLPREAAGAGVAAVMVTWNRRNVLESSIRAVCEAAARAPLPVHLIVVDNASTDGTGEHLSERWRPDSQLRNETARPESPKFVVLEPAAGRRPSGARDDGLASFTLVRNSENLGGCGGYLTGMLAARRIFTGPAPKDAERMLWLIDDDATVTPDCLAKMLQTMRSDAKIGAVGSRMADPANPGSTLEGPVYFSHKSGLLTPTPDHTPDDDPDRPRPTSGVVEADLCAASCLLVREAAAADAGLWDHRYFINGDDAEWCLRIKSKGWKVVCDLDAVHLHEPWSAKVSPVREYYRRRNLFWLWQRHLPRDRYRALARERLLKYAGLCVRQAARRKRYESVLTERAARDAMRSRGGRLTVPAPERLELEEALRRLPRGASVLLVVPGPRARKMAERWLAQAPKELVERTIALTSTAIDHPCKLPMHGSRAGLLRLHAALLRRRVRAVVVFDGRCETPILIGRETWRADEQGATAIEPGGSLVVLGSLAGAIPLALRALFGRTSPPPPPEVLRW